MARPPELPKRTSGATQGPTALDGILVIDFTRVVAGPGCTQTLGDFGATVVKIEHPEEGDDTRAYEHASTGGESAAYLTLNRNKKGIALDLSIPAARDVARELIAKADVVVENFSSSVMKKFGLDYESVAPANPRLVYCSISAYGRQGPFAYRPGFDPITQAESGFMSLNGFPEGPPLRTGPPIVDIATGMSACNAILLALIARQRIGRGQHVEVALFDVAMAMTSFYGMAYLVSGENPGRFGNSPSGSPTVGLYETANGPLYLACANDRLFRRLVTEVFARPDLLEDERFSSRKARSANKEELRAVIAEIFSNDTLENWMARMKEANIPAGHLRTVEQAFNSPEARERGRLSRIPHPTAGSVPNIESPISLSHTPAVDPRAAPLLGQHTREIMTGLLGYDHDRIEALAKEGVFGVESEKPAGPLAGSRLGR